MLKKYLVLGSILLCLAVLLSHAFITAYAQQTVVTVNSLEDADGDCSPGSINCTLRAAVGQALIGAPLTIRFAGNICGEDASCEIRLTSEIIIPSPGRDILIEGLGWNMLAISGRTVNRLFAVGDESSLTLRKLHLKDGNANTGGAVLVNPNSQLVVAESRFTSNKSSSEGGAITIDRGTAIIEDSHFDSNSALDLMGQGGAITNLNGSLYVSRSEFTKNSAQYQGGAIAIIGSNNWGMDKVRFYENNADYGGALYSEDSLGYMDNVLFHENMASSGGGGAAIQAKRSDLQLSNVSSINGFGLMSDFLFEEGRTEIRNATITGSTGGGLYIFGGLATVKETTVMGNVAYGLSVEDTGQTDVANSIFSRNGYGNCRLYGGQINDLSGNIDYSLGTHRTCGVSWTTVDPRLLPLETFIVNGHTTFVRPLRSDSPARDLGKNFNCGPTDQRGELRPIDFCDSGAYELQPAEVQSRNLTVNTLADTTPNGCTAQDCTLREAIQEANSSDQLTIITFDSALFASGPQTLTLQLGELHIQRSLVLQGPRADKLTLLARQSSPARHLWVDANQDKTVHISGLTFKGGGLPTYNCYGGGSIHIDTAQVIIEDSYFEGNRGGQGGAIFGGNVLLSRTTFVGNVASRGGAIYNAYGQLSVANSTFFNNQAMDMPPYCSPYPEGSAIYNGNYPLNIQNTTFHRNKTVYRSTAVPISGHAGAIFNSSSGSVVVGNSIINHSLFAQRTNMASEATETPLSNLHNNCRSYGSLHSVGYNIEYNTAQTNTCELLAQSDQITNPQLDVLADLPPPVIVYPVGSIPVIRLQSISPAINAGNSDICNGSLVGGRDGRGAKRPPVNCDIGAYEYGSETAEFPDTIGVFRPSSNTFYLRFSNTTGPADLAVVFGIATDLPIAGDWNGDGRSTIGLYRPSTGTFFLKNANTFDAPVAYTFTFSGASPSSVPIAGDWDADGQAGVGLYNANTGQVLLRNLLSTGFADHAMLFGMAGDLPVTGDWDGDGQDSFGIYRGDTFHLTNQVCGNNCIPSADHAFVLGITGDVPFAGDWNGNGRDGAGVFRPTNGITYFKNELTTGFADIAIVYGIAADKPIAGVWQFSGADQADAPEQPALAPTFVPR